jgi:hypothetical protein
MARICTHHTDNGITLAFRDFCDQSFRLWFYKSIRFNESNDFSKFGSYLPVSSDGSKPIIIIDHLEDSSSLWDTKNVIIGLAQSSRESNTFRVLVCVSPVEVAQMVLKWNGGQKIR